MNIAQKLIAVCMGILIVVAVGCSSSTQEAVIPEKGLTGKDRELAREIQRRNMEDRMGDAMYSMQQRGGRDRRTGPQVDLSNLPEAPESGEIKPRARGE